MSFLRRKSKVEEEAASASDSPVQEEVSAQEYS